MSASGNSAPHPASSSPALPGAAATEELDPAPVRLAPRPRVAGYLYFLLDALTLAYELALYFVAFALPSLLLYDARAEPPLRLLALALVGFLVAGAIFLFALVLTKRVLVGRVPSGRYFLTSPKARRWVLADRLIKIMIRSPFRALVNENSFFRFAFYRGMGARIHSTLTLGNGVKLPEPWALRIGKNVLIGDEAILSGHKVERGVVTLGEVEIGDDVVIGARALVLPNTRIGEGAIVGAQSVVKPGTVIPPRESWAGNPASRVDPFLVAKPRPPDGPGA